MNKKNPLQELLSLNILGGEGEAELDDEGGDDGDGKTVPDVTPDDPTVPAEIDYKAEFEKEKAAKEAALLSAKEATEQKQKWEDRFKKGRAKVGEKISEKEQEFEEMFDKKFQSFSEKTEFYNSTPEAKTYQAEIEKLAADEGLSVQKAYKLFMFDKVTDPGYVAQQRANATGVHGNSGARGDDAGAFSHIFNETPKFMKGLQKAKQ